MNIVLDLTGKRLKNTAFQARVSWDSDSEVSVSADVIHVGLGKKEKFSLQKVRKAADNILAQAKVLKAKELALDMEGFEDKFSREELLRAIVEGARLAAYRFDRHKSKPSPAPALTQLIVVFKNSPASLQKVLKETETVMDGVAFTRNMANEPANVMTPPEVARLTKAMAVKSGLTCRVLGQAEMKKMNMGGILGVSQGSSYPPQLIILENHAPAAKTKEPIVLVGKGITFDTGGISLKPGLDMDKMKFDMCGAAAVIGAMKVVAELKLPVKVIGIAPVCENMPGSKAQRPGDIIRCHNGKTVEVLNTDAEGRLILADALSYAKKFEPRVLIDVATLTGACSATFSDIAVGLMSTDASLAHSIKAAGEKTGERCWELPLWDEYYELIRATVADIQNISKKAAGTITAGMFLKEFADHTPRWAHLDIAGTAWTNTGATGIGVRLFVELIKNHL